MTEKVEHYDWKKFKQGEDWAATVTVKDGNGNVQDITGWDVKMQVRETPNGPVLLEMNTDLGGGITIDGANGQISFALPAAKTALLQFTKANYDVFVETTSGAIKCLFEGSMPVMQRYTK